MAPQMEYNNKPVLPVPAVFDDVKELSDLLRDVHASLQAMESVRARASRLLHQTSDALPIPNPGSPKVALSAKTKGTSQMFCISENEDRYSLGHDMGRACSGNSSVFPRDRGYSDAGMSAGLSESFTSGNGAERRPKIGPSLKHSASFSRARPAPLMLKNSPSFVGGSGWQSLAARNTHSGSKLNLTTKTAAYASSGSRLKSTFSRLILSEEDESEDDSLWPGNVMTRPSLKSDTKLAGLISAKSDRVSQRIVSRITQSQKNKSVGYEASEQEPSSSMFRCPLDPDKTYIIAFEAVGIAVLLHDCVVTPFIFAFDLPVQGALFILGWTCLLYWSVDFLLRWVTGFYHNGELVMEFKRILQNYILGWFVVDCLVLVSDYIVLMLELAGSGESATQMKRSYSFVRVVKVCRLLRVLRILKLPHKVSTLLTIGALQGSRSLVQGLGVLFGMLLYVHLVCCYWVAIGMNAPSDTGTTWLDNAAYGKLTTDDTQLNDVGIWFLYVTSLHWTLAQITPGPIDIVASNTIEKLFNSTFLISGLMFNGMVVSIFSGNIMQHIMRKRERTSKIESVRLFLRQNQVSTTVSAKIQKQVMARLNQVPTLMLRDVPALLNISASLRKDLMFELNSPHMMTHMAFKVFADMDMKGFHTLCNEAVEMGALSPQEDMFEPQTPAEAAYYLMRGRMVYRQEPSFSRVSDSVQKEVNPGTWISEAALWSLWTHQGQMESMTLASVLIIHSEKLLTVLGRGGMAAYIVTQYGLNFHRRIIGACPPHADFPNDLQVAYTEPNTLLSFHVSLGVLERADEDGSLNLPPDLAEELREEIRSEQCTLHRKPGTLTVERVVTIVVLKLIAQGPFAREDEVLTRVATIDAKKGFCPKLDYPGVKLAIGESLSAALDRVLHSELGGMCSNAKVRHVTQETTEEMSHKYNMPTTYNKIIQHAASSDLDKGEQLQINDERLAEDCPLERRPLYIVRDRNGQRVSIYTWISADEYMLLQDDFKEDWEKWLKCVVDASDQLYIEPVSPDVEVVSVTGKSVTTEGFAA